MKPSQDVWDINLATDTVQWLHFVIALLFLSVQVHIEEEAAIVDEPREMVLSPRKASDLGPGQKLADPPCDDAEYY